MSYEDHSEDVASDFRDALSELTINSRVEITTLTVIARENTEYAHGISEVLQEHIKKVAPQRKLPALYLLDSIVKNVGTPYTIYFGRGLYSTFMDAYASVDNGTRRKMDEMLKTWKEPVPGSVDPRPVFSLETTRPIENALIKARTSALQAQHEHMRSEQQLLGRGRPASVTPYRETSTPPTQGSRPGPPLQGPYGQQKLQPPQPTPQEQTYPFNLPIHQTTQTTPQPPIPAAAGGPFQPPVLHQSHFPNAALPSAVPSNTSVEVLNADVERLIQATKTEFAEKLYDASVAGRLKALLDLQTILKSQSLEYDKLVLVRNQIDALAVNLPSHLKALYNPTPTPPTSVLSPFQPPPAGASASGLSAAVLAALAAARASATVGATPPVQSAAFAPPHPPAQPTSGLSVDSLLGKGALAALLAARQQQPPPQQQQPQLIPQPQYVPAPTPQPPPQLPPQLPQLLQGAAAAPNASNPLALMEMLRKSGLLPQQPPASGAAHHAPAPQATANALDVSSLANIMASIRSPGFTAPRDPLREIQNEIQFESSSLKQFRPHLLPMMYDNLGPPCTQCGRRFRTDEAGRAAKTAHMDWHFKVHQRIVEAEKRGQHRSWYVDQADWIQSRETVDFDGVDHHGANLNGNATGGQTGKGLGTGGTGGTGATGGGKLQWIPVPTGGAKTNQTCPICQEKFELKWLDEAQEWVWIDATRVGSRVYHASCHAEAARNSNNRDHPAAAAMSATLSGNRGSTGLPTSVSIPTGPAADRNRHGQQQPVLGKRKANSNDDANFQGNANHRQNQKNVARGGASAAAGRKKKRGGLGGGSGNAGGPRRPPDLDRVDPDIGGGSGDGSPGSGEGAGSGGRFGRHGGKHRGGAHPDSSNSEDTEVDLNALPY